MVGAMNVKACLVWVCVAAAALVMGCGSSGSNGGLPAPVYGSPVTLGADGQWQWVPVDGAVCRDGSPAGFAINPESSSTHVMVFLEGGGACFNSTLCSPLLNPQNIPTTSQFHPSVGIFDRTNPANPVADWNFVYIPYCTGDVFAGDRPDATVPGLVDAQGNPIPQQFVGFANMQLFLGRVVPTFPNADQVLFTGVSAGGFGAASDVELAQEYFGAVPLTLLDDSGPPMSSMYIASCLQQQWRELWGFDKTLLAACGSDCPDPNDYVLDLATHLIGQYPDNVGGLVSHLNDPIIEAFYGYGNNDCQPPGLLPMLDPATFQMGLEDFRTYIDARTSNFGTYYQNESNSHTCIDKSCFYSTTINGVAETDWVANLLNGNVSNVSP